MPDNLELCLVFTLFSDWGVFVCEHLSITPKYCKVSKTKFHKVSDHVSAIFCIPQNNNGSHNGHSSCELIMAVVTLERSDMNPRGKEEMAGPCVSRHDVRVLLETLKTKIFSNEDISLSEES